MEPFELKIRLRPECIVHKLSDAMPADGKLWWGNWVDWQGNPGLVFDVPVLDPRHDHIDPDALWIHEACVAAVTGYAELRVTVPGEHQGRFIRLTRHRIEQAISRLDTGPLRDMSEHWALATHQASATEFFQICCFGSVPFPEEP